jgi:hypothetical protein
MRLFEVAFHIAAESMAEVQDMFKAVTEKEACLTCEIAESQTGKLTPILRADIQADPEPHKYKKGDKVYMPDFEVVGTVAFIQGDMLAVEWNGDAGCGGITMRSPEQVQYVEEK